MSDSCGAWSTVHGPATRPHPNTPSCVTSRTPGRDPGRPRIDRSGSRRRPRQQAATTRSTTTPGPGGPLAPPARTARRGGATASGVCVRARALCDKGGFPLPPATFCSPASTCRRDSPIGSRASDGSYYTAGSRLDRSSRWGNSRLTRRNCARRRRPVCCRARDSDQAHGLTAAPNFAVVCSGRGTPANY